MPHKAYKRIHKGIMNTTTFINLATTAGFPRALVEEFLDQLGRGRWQEITEPTLDWLAEYAEDSESEYGAQAVWDGRCRQTPINPGGYQRSIWGV
jgi:hypothetical protein